MPALDKISYYQNRRDEVPNQELAKELAQARDQTGIAEIAANLVNKNKNVHSDCLKVLYEIGCLDPALIAPYMNDFSGSPVGGRRQSLRGRCRSFYLTKYEYPGL